MSRIYFYKKNYSLIAIISLVFTLIVNINIYDYWFLTPSMQIDPWLYWGTAEAFDYIKNNFGQTYYFRRWTLIFPNLFFQSFFEPYYAQIILRSTLLFVVLFTANIWIFNKEKSYINVFSFTFLISFSEYIIRSIGNAYNMGTGCFLFLLIILLSEFQNSTLRIKILKGLLLGFLFCLLFITYQWLIYFFPILLIIALKNWKKNSLNHNLYYLLFIIIGFFSGIIIDYFIGYLLGVNWENLLTFTYNYQKSLVKSGTFGVSWSEFFQKQIFSRASFFIPFLTTLSLSLITKNKIFFILFYVGSIYIIGIFGGGNPLMTYQNNFYLAFLLIYSISIIFIQETKKYYNQLFLCFIFYSLYLGINYLFDLSNSNNYGKYLYNSFLYFILFYFILFLIYTIFYKYINLKIKNVILSILFIGCLYSYGPSMQVSADFMRHPNDMINLVKKDFEYEYIQRISSEVRSAAQLNQNNRIWILDIRESSGSGWSPVISSFYGLYSALAIGKNPGPVDCSHMNWIMAYPNSVILVYGAENFNSALALVDPLVSHCGSYNYLESKKHPLNAISISISRK
jgi:hypothetical protein